MVPSTARQRLADRWTRQSRHGVAWRPCGGIVHRLSDELGSMRPSRVVHPSREGQAGRGVLLQLGNPAPAARLYAGLKAAGPLWAANTLRERNMRTLWLGSFALCAAAMMAATAVSAAPARQSRDAAMRDCIAQARASAPRDQILAGTAADPGSGAMLVYKSCMRRKGLRP
jgi:hypothetical protein